MNELERAAHEYADRGWSVFCCKPGEKVPDTPHGFKDATTDHDQIRRWWQDRPDRNVAIATGSAGIDVLDIDVRPDRTGYTAFHRLGAAGLLTGYSRVVSTPSGGMHVYFASSGRAGGSVPAALVDFKADGGYVLAPPSVVAGRPYRVEVDLPGPHAMLDWDAARQLLAPPVEAPARSDLRPRRTAPSPAGIEHLVRHVQRQDPTSHNRNRALFWAACRATEEGLDLRPLAEAGLSIGLTATEVGRTLASAQRTVAGRAAPTVHATGVRPAPGRPPPSTARPRLPRH